MHDVHYMISLASGTPRTQGAGGPANRVKPSFFSFPYPSKHCCAQRDGPTKNEVESGGRAEKQTCVFHPPRGDAKAEKERHAARRCEKRSKMAASRCRSVRNYRMFFVLRRCADSSGRPTKLCRPSLLRPTLHRSIAFVISQQLRHGCPSRAAATSPTLNQATSSTGPQQSVEGRSPVGPTTRTGKDTHTQNCKLASYPSPRRQTRDAGEVQGRTAVLAFLPFPVCLTPPPPPAEPHPSRQVS